LVVSVIETISVSRRFSAAALRVAVVFFIMAIGCMMLSMKGCALVGRDSMA
jgi:hypothetical protein